jgi:hypothetical protein
MVRLIPVPPERLPEIWSWVRAGLLELIRKNDGRCTPEHIRAQLDTQMAYLYLVECDGIKGFMAFKKNVEIDGEVNLHIWGIWGRGVLRVLDELVTAIDELGRAIGATRVTMRSTRAWAKFGHWTEVSKNYERRI